MQRIEQGQPQRRADDREGHTGKPRPGSHVHQRERPGQARRPLRQERRQTQAVEEMLDQDPLWIGDRGQVDISIGLHQPDGIQIQLFRRFRGDRHPHGRSLLPQAHGIDHKALLSPESSGSSAGLAA